MKNTVDAIQQQFIDKSFGLVHHDLPVVVTGCTARRHNGRLQAGSETSSTFIGVLKQKSTASFASRYATDIARLQEAPILLSAVMGSLAKHAS